jgi:uncharacterized protein (TIGR03000 family)
MAYGGSNYMPSFGYNYGNGMYTYPQGYVMPYYGTSPYQSGYYTPGQGYITPGQQTPESLDVPTRPATPPGSGDRDRRDTTPPKGTGTRPPDSEVRGEAPATIVVHLPAAARLTVDGEPTYSTSDRRVFVSPPLQPGRTYHYVLEAQLQGNGETARTSQNVEVRAGRQSDVNLEFPVRSVTRR